MEMAILTRGDSMQSSLFWNGAYSDHFMDFFNTIRDSWDLSWVYQRGTFYPPLSVLVMHLFSHMIPEDLASIGFLSRYTLQYSQICIMLYFMLACVCMLLLAKMWERYLAVNGDDRTRFLVVLFLFISFPIVYCLERGNTSIIALVFCTFFVFCRNSENKVVRELSYLSLAFAAGIKIFPAAFGVLLIYDKKYKEAIRTVLYGIAAFVVPFFLVKLLTPENGMASQISEAVQSGAVAADQYNSDGSLGRFLSNIATRITKSATYTSNSTSIANLVYLLKCNNLVDKSIVDPLGMVCFVLAEIVAFIAGFFCKKEWQKQFIAVYLMLNIHAISMHYTLIYLIPPFLAFLCEKDRKDGTRTPLDWLYFACFGIQLIPIPFFFYFAKDWIAAACFSWFGTIPRVNVNMDLSCPAFQLLFFALVIEVIVAEVKRVRRAKPAKEKRSKKASPVKA